MNRKELTQEKAVFYEEQTISETTIAETRMREVARATSTNYCLSRYTFIVRF